MGKRVASENEARFARESRNNRIKKCQECKGAPPKGNFSLQGVCGEHCTLCMEVINWRKEGALIVIKEKKTATIDRPHGMSETIEVINTIIPGGKQLNFTELNV